MSDDPIPELVPPWTPNRAQIMSWLASASTGIGWLLLHAGVTLSPTVQSALFGPEALTFYSGVIFAVWPLAYGWYIHSRDGKLKAVEAMPGVVNVEIAKNATSDLKAIVADKNRPKVNFVAAPSPLTSSTARRAM
jgi:hypothetical protein